MALVFEPVLLRILAALVLCKEPACVSTGFELWFIMAIKDQQRALRNTHEPLKLEKPSLFPEDNLLFLGSTRELWTF